MHNSILCDAYSKEDFGIEDVVREVHDLVSSDDESADDEEEDEALHQSTISIMY